MQHQPFCPVPRAIARGENAVCQCGGIPRTLKELAQEALDIQNACNPLGLSKGYAVSLQELHDRLSLNGLPNDTQAMRDHPINKLWASKLHDLASLGLSDTDRYGDAYRACKILREDPAWTPAPEPSVVNTARTADEQSSNSPDA